MCGRYMLTHPVEALRALFGFVDQPNLPARFNIAPTQDVAAVRLGGDDTRRLSMLRWGLVPPWAKDVDPTGSPIINARAETVFEKPSFRSAIKRRRCLIPADGFFEWKRPAGEGRKQPFRIGLHDWQPFAFAGIWEHWTAKDGSGDEIHSCAILTTDANSLVARVHNRMPVILDPADYGHWLDPDMTTDSIAQLMAPYPAEAMDLYPVHSKVGSPLNDDPSVIDPLPAVPTGHTGGHSGGQAGGTASTSSEAKTGNRKTAAARAATAATLAGPPANREAVVPTEVGAATSDRRPSPGQDRAKPHGPVQGRLF